MKKSSTITLLAALLAVAGCTADMPARSERDRSGGEAPQKEDASVSMTSSSVASLAPVASVTPLSPLPPELSLHAFSTMRFEGKDFTLEETLDDNSVYTRHRISYRSNGLLISGIMNIPKGEGSYPVAILNHGYIATSVYTNGRGLKREQDYLARHGFAVLHPDYRGHAFSDDSPDESDIYDAGIEYSIDVVNAIHAVRAANLPHVDASKIFMMGHSMGGGVTLNIAVSHPDLVDKIVLYAPVNGDAWENFWRWRREREEGDKTLAAMGTRADNPEIWDTISSKTYFDRIQAPVLLFQGSLDKDVPKAWSDDLAMQLTKLGKDIEYVEYPGEGHEFSTQWNDFMTRTATFLTRPPPEAQP